MMKTILITCGCLEPSKDGIGDYCFNLAKAIQTLDLRVVLVSLNDYYVRNFREENREDVQICRIPQGEKWKDKLTCYENIVETVRPDHISFQYVIYAYHTKGLPVLANQFLIRFLRNYHVSIMLHEPWIGRSKEDSIRHRVIGYFQQHIIKQLITGIGPVKVFTSNLAFSNLLKMKGINNKILPLFSNIPYKVNAIDLIKSEILEQELFVPESSLKIVLFGRIPFQWKMTEFARWVGDRKVILFTVGRSDQDQANNIKKRLGECNNNITLIALGERNPDFISGLLQFVDAGLALTPPEILGKSGVVAAYKEHGLPVILAGKNEEFSQVAHADPSCNDKIVLDLSMDHQDQKFNRKPVYSGVELIANLFLENIKKPRLNPAVLV